jgi:hypothetical protein
MNFPASFTQTHAHTHAHRGMKFKFKLEQKFLRFRVIWLGMAQSSIHKRINVFKLMRSAQKEHEKKKCFFDWFLIEIYFWINYQHFDEFIPSFVVYLEHKIASNNVDWYMACPRSAATNSSQLFVPETWICVGWLVAE